ncbi:MAG: putative polyferredoxin [Bacillales bacterium]|jgi:ferredoxin|nr:putative polyferredoxin [Bacillales bacterium]
MLGILLYFSGTGNTKLIADNFLKVYNQKNITLDILSIEAATEIDNSKYNFIIIGFPNHFGSTPKFFVDYLISRIPPTKVTIPVGLFCTEAIPDSTSFVEVEDIMSGKNYNIITKEHFHMPNNLRIEEISNITNEEVDEEKIFSKIQLFVEAFSFNKCNSENFNVIGHSFSVVQDNLLVDKNLCIKCRFCLRNCPFDNIKFEDQQIKILENCENCMRCVNICPKNAINYSNSKINQYKDNIGLVFK